MHVFDISKEMWLIIVIIILSKYCHLCDYCYHQADLMYQIKIEL